MKRVICLYRVSTKGQVDKDDIPMQRIECRKFIEAQGWMLVGEYAEKGVSGFKVSAEKRDAITSIRKEAERGAFEILSGKWIQTHDCEHGPKPHEIRHFASIA